MKNDTNKEAKAPQIEEKTTINLHFPPQRIYQSFKRWKEMNIEGQREDGKIKDNEYALWEDIEIILEVFQRVSRKND